MYWQDSNLHLPSLCNVHYTTVHTLTAVMGVEPIHTESKSVTLPLRYTTSIVQESEHIIIKSPVYQIISHCSIQVYRFSIKCKNNGIVSHAVIYMFDSLPTIFLDSLYDAFITLLCKLNKVKYLI